MKYRNIFRSMIALTAVVVISCQKEYVPLDTVDDVSWYTSETIKQADGEYKVNADSLISFMDLSQGVLTHQWIIEEGSNFMIDDFDYYSHPYIDQIDPSKGKISTDAVVNVCFSAIGETKVTLLNTFASCVSSNTETPVVAVQDGDEWLLTKEFIVTVYDVLIPSFEVYHINADGEEVLIRTFEENYQIDEDKDNWDSVEITSGESIRFVDLLGGDSPDGRVWSVGESTYSDEISDVTFSTPGTYSDFSIKSTRSVPSASVSRIIPLSVVVNQSTEPFYVNEAKFEVDVNNPNTIFIPAKNGAFLSAAGVVDDFSVSVTTGEGIEVPDISIASVGVSTSDSAILEVVLSSPIYPLEVITLSYAAGENTILASDGIRDLQDFSDVTVTNAYAGVSVMSDSARSLYGFEEADGAYWTADSMTQYLSLDTETYYSGAQSLKVDATNGLSSNIYYMPNESYNFEVSKGTYLLKLRIYVESAGDGLSETYYAFINNKTFSWLQNSAGDYVPFWYPATTGEWVEQTLIIAYADDPTSVGYRLDFFSGLPAGTVLYVDDIDLIQLRP